MLLCNEYFEAEEGGCCYARSMSWLKRVDLLCKEYVVAEEGGCCYARSMSRLKGVPTVQRITAVY